MASFYDNISQCLNGLIIEDIRKIPLYVLCINQQLYSVQLDEMSYTENIISINHCPPTLEKQNEKNVDIYTED